MIRFVCDLCGSEAPARQSSAFIQQSNTCGILYRGILVEVRSVAIPERVPPGTKVAQFEPADLCQPCLAKAIMEGKPTRVDEVMG